MGASEAKNEIVVYQPNGSVRLEAELHDESIWLTQQKIAALFGVQKAAISKHLKNIFATEELQEDQVVSKMETTTSHGTGVSCTVYTKHCSKRLALDVRRHNEQYAPIAVKPYRGAHDRFLIADSTVYHVGASLKDLGKSLFAFSRLVTPASTILAQIEAAKKKENAN